MPLAFPLQLLVDAQRRNPYPLYHVLRRLRPVAFVPRANLWLVARYQDARRVLSDYESFSSDFAVLAREAGPTDLTTRRALLITSDPPVHTKLRGLITRAFTARTVAALEPRIEELTHEMLDRVVASGRIDLIQDLAYPLPVIVIAEMLGVPAEDRALFKQWSDAVVASADALFTNRSSARQLASGDRAATPLGALSGYLASIIALRRKDPRDDLVSALIGAELDGEQLDDQDVLSICWLLLIAGNVTTTNLIGNAVLALSEHPSQYQRLLHDRSLVPTAIEEVLRYRSPVQMMFRIARQDVQLGGRVIRRGQLVMALIGSANRDPSVFHDADRFDVGREPNPHIAFGYGVHYCLGAPLARLEGRVALNVILDRLPDLARVDRRLLPPIEGLIVHGYRTLPLRFTPSAPVARAVVHT